MPTSHSISRGAVTIPTLEYPVSSMRRSILMLHGIFSEKTEDGRFTRLATEFQEKGVASWQFDFQGHGDSPMPSDTFTVAAALADFVRMAQMHREAFPGVPRGLIASSFGGSVALLAAASGHLAAFGYDRLVLLNPVTDYRSSFLEPFGQQMQEVFTPSALARIRSEGEAEVQPRFRLGLPVLMEFELLRPSKGFASLHQPTLLLQGDQDTAVSHEVVKRDSRESDHVLFETIRGAAHAFAEPKYERITFDMMQRFFL